LPYNFDVNFNAGTETGIYASFSGDDDWIPLHLKNMPWSIAVRDMARMLRRRTRR
jgi:hypothetical protein